MWVVLLLHVSGDDAHEDVAHLTNNSRCGRKQLILKYLLSLIPSEKPLLSLRVRTRLTEREVTQFIRPNRVGRMDKLFALPVSP